MAFDLQEQEQIESLKVVWNQYGKWVASAVLVLAAGYLGFKGYQLYQVKQVEASAAVYTSVERAGTAQDFAGLKNAVAQIENSFGASPYAPRAAFLAARMGFEKNDLTYARDQLNWVVANAKEQPLVALAHLRLASILTDQKQYDAALAQLENAHDGALDPLFFDAKGDVYALKGDKGAARDAYKAALAKLQGDSPNRPYIQTKLDALGS